MAKILIIDDDRAVVDSTADMLKSFEFNVITATDGKKGFELADLERPDVIILDWMMPGYSGMQFIKDYRDQGYKTPVLFLTGKGDLSQYQVEALRAGADDYVSKPYEPMILVENCDLTNREFQLLQYLEQNMGRVCSRSELLKQVWKFDFLGDERTVDVTIKRTRQKIEPDQKNFKYILTRRGFGYFFPNDLDQ